MTTELDPTDASEGSAVEADARVRSAWRSWLSALATDAEAAMAAALTYESLPAAARDAWLDALEADGDSVGVPALALYAPLLAVETDAERRARIERSLTEGALEEPPSSREPKALCGVGADGTHACVIFTPVYLDFVSVLSCRYTPGGGFVAATHDRLRHAADFQGAFELAGVSLEPTPLRVVVEELAHAVLADKRGHRATPAAVTEFAHLFAPSLEDGDADEAGPKA